MNIQLIKKTQIYEGARVLIEGGWHSLEDAQREIKTRMKRKEVFVAIINKEIVGIFIYFKNYSHEANTLDYIAVSKEYQKIDATPRLKRCGLIVARFLDARKFFQKRIFCTEICNFKQISCDPSVEHTLKGVVCVRHLDIKEKELQKCY